MGADVARHHDNPFRALRQRVYHHLHGRRRFVAHDIYQHEYKPAGHHRDNTRVNPALAARTRHGAFQNGVCHLMPVAYIDHLGRVEVAQQPEEQPGVGYGIVEPREIVGKPGAPPLGAERVDFSVGVIMGRGLPDHFGYKVVGKSGVHSVASRGAPSLQPSHSRQSSFAGRRISDAASAMPSNIYIIVTATRATATVDVTEAGRKVISTVCSPAGIFMARSR